MNISRYSPLPSSKRRRKKEGEEQNKELRKQKKKNCKEQYVVVTLVCLLCFGSKLYSLCGIMEHRFYLIIFFNNNFRT